MRLDKLLYTLGIISVLGGAVISVPTGKKNKVKGMNYAVGGLVISYALGKAGKYFENKTYEVKNDN